MLFIVVPTILGSVSFAWWYRASNRKAKRRPDFVYSGRIEILVWSLPFLTILFLSGIIWIGSHRLDPARPIASSNPPIDIQVVSMDWKWLFLYPQQGVATVNELVIPKDVPIHFSLTSSTVTNSFFVPRLGGMIAVMNGMVTHLNLMADRVGAFGGMSTQFSGDGFADMNFRVRAATADDFQAWLAKVRTNTARLDEAELDRLSRPTTLKKPLVFGAIDGGLFNQVVGGETHMVSRKGQ